MTASTPQHEPTMEEILASIRKIISEDQTDPNAAGAKAPEPVSAPVSPPVSAAPVSAAPAPAPALSDEIEVLELTDEVLDELPAEPEPMPEPEPEPEPMLADEEPAPASTSPTISSPTTPVVRSIA